MPDDPEARGTLPPRAGGGAPQAPAGRLRTWARFVRFEHTLFSLPLLFAGVFLGAGGLDVPLSLLGLVLIAGTGARTAALGLNRIIDRRIDAANPRTGTRELPSGAMSLAEARTLTLAGALVYAVAAWWISPLCLALAPVPLAVFVGYPYLKRWTPWCHLGVGLGLAMAPLGGWFAVRLGFEDIGPAILLALFTLAWVAGFDVIYATLDEEFDRGAGIRSLPARHGRATALRIARALHVVGYAALATLVWWRLAWLPALVPLLAVGALLSWEHARARDIDLAFFRINVWVGFAAMATIAAGLWSPVPG
jgi:4-hydroxybenzoate polyprenyltransferase